MNHQGRTPKNEGAESSAPLKEQSPVTKDTEAGLTIKPRVPDYELIRRIGRGAYGEVWLARSKATGVFRAAKIVWRHTFNEDRPFNREFEGIQRFERVSREHPSQLAFFHIGRNEEEGYFYYVMELADDAAARNEAGVLRKQTGGKSEHTSPSFVSDPLRFKPHTLRAELDQGRLPAARALEIGLALAEALGHLHRHGLVHRDVKPSNVIFVNGRPKLADIGLVTDASDNCSIVGTEGYLPPEGPGTPQADIFALGKVLYEAATGLDRRAFPDLPPDIRDWPDATQVFELNEVILKACASDAEDRYQNAAAMRGELALIARGKSVKQKRSLRRWRQLGIKAVCLGATATVVALVLHRRSGDQYVKSNDSQINALMQEGNYCIQTCRPDEASKLFHSVIDLDPTYVPAYEGLFRANATQESRAVLAKLRQLAPNGAGTHTASSWLKWRDWHFHDALAEGRLATKAPADSPEARYVSHTIYGFELVQSGKPDEALAEYQAAAEIFPSNANVQKHLGHAYFEKRQFDLALAQYQKAIDLEPRLSQSYYFKARVMEELTNFTAAIQCYEEMQGVNGTFGAAAKALTDDLRAALRQNGARGYWSKRLEHELKKSPQDIYEIARLYATLGDREQAYAWLEKACEGHTFTEGPLFDLCWDHSDPRFIAIVRRIGLLE